MSESTQTPTALLPGDGRTQFQVDRLAFFSDAVFAIAITLLALNIHAPTFTGGPPDERALLRAIGYMVPRIVGFALSFLVIGTYWRAHHRLFRWVRGYTPRLLTLNSLLLLAVSFIPAPTGFYSDYPSHRVPLIFYASSLAVVGVMNHRLWRYLTRHPGVRNAPGGGPLAGHPGGVCAGGGTVVRQRLACAARAHVHPLVDARLHTADPPLRPQRSLVHAREHQHRQSEQHRRQHDGRPLHP